MITKEMIATLEERHKRVAHVVSAHKNNEGSPHWEVVLRRPSRAEYNRFRTQAMDPARKADAQDVLVRQIAVEPAGEAIGALIDEWPAIPEACGEAIDVLSGMSAGKL
jgi:hypothetical protein